MSFLEFLYDSGNEVFLIEFYIKLDFLQILVDLSNKFIINDVVDVEPKNRDFFVFFKDNLRLLKKVALKKSELRLLKNYLENFQNFNHLIFVYKRLKQKNLL
jgi:hypothetical protein